MASQHAIVQQIRSRGNTPKTKRPRRPPLWMRWAMTSIVGLAAWIPCEGLGGLLFLVLGLRLWTYHITPVFCELTSLVGWLFVLLVLGTNCTLYLLWEQWAAIRGRRRWAYRALFLVVSGPINEIVWNSLIWWAWGTPLYLYDVGRTFEGSGSLLSPLYYLTLLTGFWLDERIPGTLAFRRYAARRTLPCPQEA
jgi:hypothetical protein